MASATPNATPPQILPPKALKKQNQPTFRLQRQLDPIAILALVLGLINGGYQIVESRARAEVEFIRPAQVELRQFSDRTIVHAPMSYSNKARKNGVISSETVVLEVVRGTSTRRVELHWQSFIVTDHNQEAAIRVIGGAQAFHVEGNGAASHETAFYPRQVPCEGCPDEERFKNYLDWGVLLKADRVNLEFTVEQIDGDPFVVRCYMPLDGGMRDYMRRNGIFTRTCVAV